MLVRITKRLYFLLLGNDNDYEWSTKSGSLITPETLKIEYDELLFCRIEFTRAFKTVA